MFRLCCKKSSLFKKLIDYKDRSKRNGRMQDHWPLTKNLRLSKQLKNTMNDCTPILGENSSTHLETENEIDKYAVAVTKYAQVIGHLKKGKTSQ